MALLFGPENLSLEQFILAMGYFLSFPLSSYIIPIFIYSEMDSTCLRLHKFWKKRKIAWHEVTSAGRFGFGTDDVDDVIVRFGHQIEDYNYILTQPADREGFLAAIRQYAPKAKVEV